MENANVYREVQRLRQWWIWLLVIFVVAIAWWAFLEQIVLHRPTGESPTPDLILWIAVIVIGSAVPLIIFAAKMTIEVKQDRVIIRYFPFYSKTILLKDVANCTPVEYHPIREYGGWGIRWSFRKGMAYTVSGHRGVWFEMKNGVKILIGSQKADVFVTAVNRRRAEIEKSHQ